MHVPQELLSDIIHNSGVIAFSQIPDALPAKIRKGASRRSLNAALDATLNELQAKQPNGIAKVRARVRLFAPEEVDVLWDSALHDGPMPVAEMRDTLWRHWKDVTPNLDVDLYCSLWQMREGLIPVNDAQELSAHLMAMGHIYSLYPYETRKGKGWGSFRGVTPGASIRHHFEVQDEWQTELYAPCLVNCLHQLQPNLFDAAMEQMELYATHFGGRLQVLSPRLGHLPWPEFEARKRPVGAAVATNIPWTAWDEELSWGWG